MIARQVGLELAAPGEPALREPMDKQDRTPLRVAGLDDVETGAPPPVVKRLSIVCLLRAVGDAAATGPLARPRRSWCPAITAGKARSRAATQFPNSHLHSHFSVPHF